MDKRIINTYVKKTATKNIKELVNVLYVALNGDSQQAKALILSVLLEEPKWE